MKKDFELVPHTADIKLRVYGLTLKELFCNALVGMFQSIGPQTNACAKIKDRLHCSTLPIERELAVQSIDKESLLVDFLSDALYLSDVHDEVYLDVDIDVLDEKRIDATLKGIKVDGFEVVEIKAVTYHDLHIKKTKDGWQVDIVFDI